MSSWSTKKRTNGTYTERLDIIQRHAIAEQVKESILQHATVTVPTRSIISFPAQNLKP